MGEFVLSFPADYSGTALEHPRIASAKELNSCSIVRNGCCWRLYCLSSLRLELFTPGMETRFILVRAVWSKISNAGGSANDSRLRSSPHDPEGASSMGGRR